MSDWLRWPRLWYATPTFVTFIALQAPDWRFTGRVWVALVVWSLVGVAIDARMNRHQRKPGAGSRKGDLNRHMNASVILGFALGISALVFRPGLDSVGHVAFAPVLNGALQRLGILLPALDGFHRELVERSRSDFAAYLGTVFVLLVAIWLVEFFLFYRSFARLPQTEFAKGVAASKGYGGPPYGPRKRQLASAGLMLYAVLLLVSLLFFGRILPAGAAEPGKDVFMTYVVFGLAAFFVNLCIYAFHSCRRFLSTLQPGGLLVVAESYGDERP